MPRIEIALHLAARVAATALLLVSSVATAQVAPIRLDSSPWNGPDLKSGTAFGTAIAASDHRILVGVPNDSRAGWRAGAVFVFERVGPLWLPVARWTANDAQAFDQFGHSVAIAPDGRTGFVGAWLAAGAVQTSGAVYVFERGATEWRQVAKLHSADGAPNDGFGTALATDGARLVVGACYADDGAFQSGSAYVFETQWGTWAERAKLVPSEVSFLAGFGCAATLAGDRIAIGAPRADTAGTDSGAVFVFEHDGASWFQAAYLAPPGFAPGAGFGSALALTGDSPGDLLAVGAPAAEVAGVRGGRVTLLVAMGQGWTPVTDLALTAPAAGDAFGSALTLDPDNLIAGAPGASGTGSALRFTRARAEWSLVETLVAPGGRPGDAFGTTVATSIGNPVIGAPGADRPSPDDPGAGANAGLGWVFDG